MERLIVSLACLIMPLCFAEAQRCQTDLLVIMDNSGSVQTVFDQEKSIAASLIDALNVAPGATRVACIVFDAHAKTTFSFGQMPRKDEVIAAIREVPGRGGVTNIAEALQMAADDFRRFGRTGDVNRIVLIVTDGHSMNTIADLYDAVRALNASGVTTYVATASDAIDSFEFAMYTGHDSQRQFLKNNITALPRVISRFIDSQGCLPDETPGPALALAVVKPTPTVEGDCQVDVMVVLDSSQSVEADFEKEKAEAVKFVEGLDIRPQATRVSLIEFYDHAHKLIGFGQHENMANLTATIMAIPHRGGMTNTVDGLEMALKEIKSGSRPEASKIVLLVTDGHSMNTMEVLHEVVKMLHQAEVSIYVASASEHIGADEFEIFLQGDYRKLFLRNNMSSLSETAQGISSACQQEKPQSLPVLKNNVVEEVIAVENCPVDFMVILDNSESVEQVFQKEKQEAMMLVQKLPIGREATRVGLIEFHDRAQTIFGFRSFNNESAIEAAIEGVKQVGGSTNTFDALQLAAVEFNATARPGAYRSALLITDGHSRNTMQDLHKAVYDLMDAGVDMYVATASDDIDPRELGWLIENEWHKLYLKSNVSSLHEAAVQIGDRCRLKLAKAKARIAA